MIDFDIDIDVSELERALAGLEKQIPFATSYALNLTAADVQQALKDSLPDMFTLRNNWTERGVWLYKSNKRNLVASIGHGSDYMEQHVTGLTKRDHWVPVGARKTETSKVSRRLWPGKAKSARRKPFKAKIGTTFGVWQRRGKKRFPVRLLWALVDEATVKPRWQFAALANEVFPKSWPRHVRKAIDRAIKTALR